MVNKLSLVLVCLLLFSGMPVMAQDYCRGNFDCDEDCDGSDAALFKADFGRSPFDNPCFYLNDCPDPWAPCPSGMIVCDNICIDPMKDRNYCGATEGCVNGVVCQVDEICTNGICMPWGFCPEGMIDCGGSCRDPLTDREYCGADVNCLNGDVCDSGEICTNGVCVLSCPADLTECNEQCVDTDTDESNCGSCGNVCSGGICVAGECGTAGCPSGLIDCGGTCIDPMKDRDYCGVTAGCVGGVVCEDGQICDAGICVLNCPPNLTNCSGACVDTYTDENFCGSCSNTCTSEEICVAGICEIAGQVVIYEAAVPKTGQTTLYATGDDGDWEAGVAWPNPRFTVNVNGTVTDNMTGLIWLRNANCFGNPDWAGAVSDCNGLHSGQCGLTDGSSAGDWRLANIFELESLLTMKYVGVAIPNTSGTGQWSQGNPFNNVQNAAYWSSTTFADYTPSAWVIRTGNARRQDLQKAGSYAFVWPVRGGQ